MLKTLFDCAINEKICSVDGGRGICPPLSSPPRGTWQLKSPHPRKFAIQGKKSANARGSARGGGGLGAAGIDWCIKLKGLCFNVASRCLLFSKTNLRQENRSKLSFTARIITKYSLERFLSICGEKMSKGFLKFYKLIIKPDTRSDHCLKSYKRA